MACGTVSVPEDHAKPDGRRIPLTFMVFKSRSLAPAPDAVVHLHGGPGVGIVGAGRADLHLLRRLAGAARCGGLRPARGGHLRRGRDPLPRHPGRPCRGPGPRAGRCGEARGRGPATAPRGHPRLSRRAGGGRCRPVQDQHRTERPGRAGGDARPGLSRLQRLWHLLRHQARAGGDAHRAGGPARRGAGLGGPAPCADLRYPGPAPCRVHRGDLHPVRRWTPPVPPPTRTSRPASGPCSAS